MTKRLSSLFHPNLPVANFTAEDTDELIERAIKAKSNEIYLMLLQYKRDRLGFGDAEERK